MPDPRSCSSGTPALLAIADELRVSDLAGEALDAIVRGVDLQDHAGFRVQRRDDSPSGACDWSCRPRPAARPARAMISGMRKAPPISMSSPRDTTASRPLASVLRHSSTAAALLLTTVASSAPVNAHSKDADVVVALAALAGLQVEFERDRHSA